MEKEIEVSVFCLAYNHERYIKEALEGFVRQKTNFAFEVIVHDDASTDGTAMVIRDYAERYPDIIKPILQTENQYSKGTGILKNIVFPKLKGRYLAICEGDDCWTDPMKLQKQFDLLEDHPHCYMSAHNAEYYDCETKKTELIFPNIQENRMLSTAEVIYGDGGFLHTGSLFCRREVFMEPMKFQEFWNIDYSAQIRGSLYEGIAFLKDNMSIYRYQVPGSWTVRNKDDSKQIQVYQNKEQMLRILDEETARKYHKIIEKKILQICFQRDILERGHKNALSGPYKSAVKDFSLKEKIKFYLSVYCPTVFVFCKEIYHRIRK